MLVTIQVILFDSLLIFHQSWIYVLLNLASIETIFTGIPTDDTCPTLSGIYVSVMRRIFNPGMALSTMIKNGTSCHCELDSVTITKILSQTLICCLVNQSEWFCHESFKVNRIQLEKLIIYLRPTVTTYQLKFILGRCLAYPYLII